SLRAIAREHQSRSTTRSGLLYDILQTLFPADFLRKVINIAKLNKNATQRDARASAFEALRQAQVLDLQATIDTWPSLPDDALLLKRCSEYVDATTITPPMLKKFAPFTIPRVTADVAHLHHAEEKAHKDIIELPPDDEDITSQAAGPSTSKREKRKRKVEDEEDAPAGLVRKKKTRYATYGVKRWIWSLG
ncbi:hypothetical protein FRC17_008321, partial [Serendipita sp. 399]